MHGKSMLVLLHSAFILSVVKMLLKGEVGGCALNSHGNYIVDHGISWKNHEIVFLNFCWNPCLSISEQLCVLTSLPHRAMGWSVNVAFSVVVFS